MAYLIYQTEGVLASAAHEYTSLRLAGNMSAAVDVYRKATGDNRPQGNDYNSLPSLDSVWWIYNVDSVIRSISNVLTAADWNVIYSTYDNDEKRARAACKLATRKVGGTWEYTWEY